MESWARTTGPAAAGVAAGGLTLGIGELAARAVGPGSAPFLALGDAFVDLTPEWLKSFAIRTFGANDKVVLLLGMGAAVLAGAALAGLLERRRPPWGAALLAVAGALGTAAALTRPGATPVDAVPSLLGIVVGVAVLRILMSTLARADSAGASARSVSRDRRRFLVLTVVTAGLGILAAVGGQRLGQTVQDLRAARDELRLPRPADPAPPVPAGAQLDVDGLTAFRTPNAEFYRVDTALSVPRVAPEEWRLRVHGLVDEPFELSFDDVLDLHLVERMITLTCVSNEVGGELAGNAVWLGYPLGDLLDRARPSADADMVLSTSADGFTASTPLAVLTDGRDALLAIGMNGEPLPLEHGFPARLVVPGLYGYVSATKWVVDLEVTRFDQATAYWTDRGWAAEAPIKTASRIDVPGSFADLAVGPITVAGVAWAQHRGVAGVEVQVDDGPWSNSRLADEASADTWRQWTWTWDATPGRHTLFVRATDGTGEVQTEDEAPPFPNGSSGWHSVVVEVS